MARTHSILVFAFWAHIFMLIYFVGWSMPERENASSSALIFFILGLASAAFGSFWLYRLYLRRQSLSPGLFQTDLMIGMACLELPALLGIFVVGPIRFEPLTQILVGIPIIAMPIGGLGNVFAYWKNR